MRDEFEFLRPEDIPPRRRSPNEPEDQEDLLTKELFGDLASNPDKPDELTKVIFADVRPATEALEPQSVDLATEPAEATPVSKSTLSPREELLRAIEELDEADFERVREYVEGPILVSTKKEPPRSKKPPPPRLPARPAGGQYADRQPRRPVPTPQIYSVRARPRLAHLKKIILAVILLGALGAIAAVASPDRILAPLRLSLESLSGLGGKNFLGASFIVSNKSESSPLNEFLNILLAREGEYLVVGTNPSRNAPIGAEPATYALVQVRDGKAAVTKEGAVAELNAALPAKIIPPEPVQALKTNFDFFETGWFFEISDFARAFSDLFTQTVGRRSGGVVLVSSEFAARLASVQRVSLVPSEPGWVAMLLNSLSGGAQEGIIESALAARELQFYFFDETLMSEAQRRGLFVPLSFSSGRDAFLVGLRSWEGGRAELELIEYQPQFFIDGSIVSTLDIRLANPTSAPLTVYVKTAVPKGSILLAEAGFSEPLAVPSFDYQAHGFKENPYLSKPLSLPTDFFPQLDFFEEGEFAVIGGWVRLTPRSTETPSIRYRLPYRLDWQRGRDNYILQIFKSGLADEIPLRYLASLVEGVNFEWREPRGYLAAGVAEYQTILRRDETLHSTLEYPQ